jgi:hypothetical protein
VADQRIHRDGPALELDIDRLYLNFTRVLKILKVLHKNSSDGSADLGGELSLVVSGLVVFAD